MEDTDVSMMKLSELEAIIERGLSSFIEVGNALTEIRDARMYGKEYSTFEEYCEGRWGFQNKRAYQLIDAAKCVAEMSTVVEPSSLPTTERQVRELKKATSDPAEQAKILKKAAKAAPKDASGKPKLTAGIIKKAAEKPKPSSDPEADRAAAIMASHRASDPTPDEDGPDRTQRSKTPPAVTSNGSLGLFDAADQRAWRDAYGVIHRLMAKGLKVDFKKFGPIDSHLSEFYKSWTAANPGKWS